MRSVVAVIILFVTGSVQAAPITWTLNNVVFDDGATVTGSFVYDQDTNLYSEMSITVAGGYMFDPYGFPLAADPFTWAEVQLSPDSSSTNETRFLVRDSIRSGGSCQNYCTRQFRFVFDTALTNVGGTANLLLGAQSYERLTTSSSSRRRDIVSGTISAVPVPAAVWLFASALGGLGWMRRRKTV